MVNETGFTHQLEEFSKQLIELREHIATHKDSEAIEALMVDLFTSLEELHIAEEELYAQDEALVEAHQNLVAAHQHFRELFEDAPWPYIVTDLNGLILEANREASHIFNVPERFLIGKPLRLYVAPDDRGVFRQRILRFSESNPTQSWEMYLQPRDKQVLLVAVTCAMGQIQNRASNSKILRWLFYDLTLRKQAEEMEREKIFRSSFEQVSVGMAYLTPDGKWLRVNDKLCKFLDYTREELLSTNFREITVADDIPQSNKAYQDILYKRAESITSEVRLIRKDKTVVWASITTSLIDSGDQQPLCFISVIEDINARKQTEIAEKELRILSQALENTAIQITSTLELDEVLELVLLNLKQVISYDASMVILIENDRTFIAKKFGYAESGLSELDKVLNNLEFKINDLDMFKKMTTSRQPISSADISPKAGFSDLPQINWLNAFLAAPIVMHSDILGFLILHRLKANDFAPTEVTILQAFSAQAATAIRNAQLYHRTRELAIIEERHRLARELHDSVSQTLFASVLLTETIPKIFKRDPGEAFKRLDELLALNHGAIAEMRILLLELRPEHVSRLSLRECFIQLSEAAKGRDKIVFRLDLDTEEDISPEVRFVFFRITQEAINNVVKHAFATEVSIRLENASTKVILRIADNGRGFNTGRLTGGLGMSSMRERAQEIDAQFSVQSTKNQGTEVIVIWSKPVQMASAI